jgi:hypothetical protein
MPIDQQTHTYDVRDLDTTEKVGAAFANITHYPDHVKGTKYGRYDIEYADHTNRTLWGRSDVYRPGLTQRLRDAFV